MAALISLVLFALGAIFASFAGAVAARISTGQAFFKGRSMCDYCGAPLTARSLIPIGSYFLTGGRAACCGARLSPIAPLSEAALGVLFVLAYLKLDLSLGLFFALVALVFLTVLVLYDLAHHILPPLFLAGFVGAAFLMRVALSNDLSSFGFTLIFAAACALLLALIHLFSAGKAMGLADAPLVFGLALFSGPLALAGLAFSFWIGAAIGIIMLARRAKGSRMNTEVPFAPFLAAGYLLAYFTQWNPFALLAALH